MASPEKFTKFFGYNTPLSSYRFSKFKIGDVEYASLEHYYQYQKAKYFGDMDAAKAALEAKTPAEARKLGQKWADSDESRWLTAAAFDIMLDGCKAKFIQNEGARKYLFKTAGTTIVDCNPWDNVWGIGVSRFDKRSDNTGTWEGKNWSGKILMMVRETLMNRPEYDEELAKIKAEQAEANKENIKPKLCTD